MLMLPTALKISLAIELGDRRKQFNGRWTLATERLRENPQHGAAAFIFANKDRDRIKILFWEDILFLVGWRSGNGRWPGLDPA